MEKLTVSSSPHIRASENTRSVMLDVLIALAFPLAIAVYYFGPRVLSLAACSVICCVVFEGLYRKLLKKPNSLGDMSAPVTGILLCFVLPVSAPYWLVALGAFFAIVVVKQLYGGLGKNFLNPALAARAFLAGFSSFLVYIKPLADPYLPVFGNYTADAVAQATPLSYLKDVEKLSIEQLPVTEYDWFKNLFLGQMPGSIGEVSSVLLLMGGLYLVVRRVITPRIPAAFIGTVALLTFLFPRGGIEGFEYMRYNLLSGGLILGAVFMATDYATSPITPRGQWVYGVGCGLLTVFFRYFSAMPEGVCYAILLMNTLVWTLDKIGAPRRFGRRWP
ncbi:MAG: RnfABCDGE type electron transport complex subunit D [Oscillospiraceae bacterium]|nr:RnfABCDGE type electron transport complex subunit D [Oscillospiraceae bacterium]